MSRLSRAKARSKLNLTHSGFTFVALTQKQKPTHPTLYSKKKGKKKEAIISYYRNPVPRMMH